MQAIVLTEPGHLAFDERPAPADPLPGHALVRVHRIGVCGTDFHAYRGRQTFFTYPRILGHELGVEIVAVNPAPDAPSPVAVGDHCAIEPYLYCGKCIACRQGRTNCCVNMQVMGVHVDGGMRPYLTVPLHHLHPSRTLSLDQLALVEMLTIGAHAVDRPATGAGETALVLGVGPIGLTVIQFAQAAGAHILAADIDEQRLAFCREQLGVEHTLLVGDTLADQVRDLTDGDMATIVFDATGNPASMNGSLRYLANAGRLVFVGHYPGDLSLSDPEFHRRETTLYGSRNSTARDFRRVISLMESGQVDTTPWITHRVAFPQVIDVFPTLLSPEVGVIKAVIEV